MTMNERRAEIMRILTARRSITMPELEMPKKTPYKERKAEADEALEKFWAMLEGNEALQEQLDDVLSLMRAYAFDQNRACYLQGVRDFRGLMLGTVPTLEEGDDSDGE